MAIVNNLNMAQPTTQAHFNSCKLVRKCRKCYVLYDFINYKDLEKYLSF